MDEGRWAPILGELPSARPLRVLDIGCSDCAEAEAVMEAGAELTGIDQDGPTVGAAADRVPGARFLALSGAEMDGRLGRFDVVLMRRPNLLMRPAGWAETFRRLPLVIAEGAKVVVTTPGEAEARAAERLLAEQAATTERKVIDMPEEKYLVVGADIEPAPDAPAPKTLRERLMWDDGLPAPACDVRTGTCSVPVGGGRHVG